MTAKKAPKPPPILVTVEATPPTTLAEYNRIGDLVNEMSDQTLTGPDQVGIGITPGTIAFCWIV